TARGATGLIHDAIRRGIAIYSPHTALDVAEGGTNDVLADALSLTDRRPLKVRPARPTQYKLVTFVPVDAVAQVSRALFEAGAGVIGNYSHCSFRTRGSGTFFGHGGTSPTVGQAGRLEEVEEVRLETVVPIDRAEPVVAALRASHPYEEVAFDLQVLAGDPRPVGIGRIGRLPGDATADMLANLLRRALEIERLLVAGEATRLVKRVAVCAGACGGELLDEAIAQQADLYVTGEMRHHDALRAIRENVTVFCTLHSNSERAALRSLAGRLNEALPGLQILRSRQDHDPFSIL
ncbi:MAG: Nif3-like dinuclear metal center hexameric protein, partial [Phycisphaerae bacterium]|nr:Nif3-like dinuclear metal center hexameric protein [Phycisphaerae bacterium]MDW8261624.1 Nif3-like dinuclear metal center hexameric protein [Phycisphaerales bacterium]